MPKKPVQIVGPKGADNFRSSRQMLCRKALRNWRLSAIRFQDAGRTARGLVVSLFYAADDEVAPDSNRRHWLEAQLPAALHF